MRRILITICLVIILLLAGCVSNKIINEDETVIKTKPEPIKTLYNY